MPHSTIFPTNTPLPQTKPTQYDHIGSKYGGLKSLSAGLLEEHNLHLNSQPHIHNARVLDLACGTGHYTRLAVQWGAKAALGTDISPAMVKAARNIKHDVGVSYTAADATAEEIQGGGEFDAVLGSWVLNYAKDGETMAKMFATAYKNLKEGGRFVCILPHPSEQPRDTMEEALKVRPSDVQGEHWITMTPTRDLEEGVRTRIDAMTDRGFVTFEAYHLRKTVVERAARKGGFDTVEWRRIRLPKGWEDDWRRYESVPHFGVLVVRKKFSHAGSREGSIIESEASSYDENESSMASKDTETSFVVMQGASSPFWCVCA